MNPPSKRENIEQVAGLWVRRVTELDANGIEAKAYFEVVDYFGGLVTAEQFPSLEAARDWPLRHGRERKQLLAL